MPGTWDTQTTGAIHGVSLQPAHQLPAQLLWGAAGEFRLTHCICQRVDTVVINCLLITCPDDLIPLSVRHTCVTACRLGVATFVSQRRVTLFFQGTITKCGVEAL
jgi:hypothetical protein